MSTAQNAVTAKASDGSATIHARVGDSAIDKVTRLFSTGLADIFTETLQNSRRGGANARRRDHRAGVATPPASPSPTTAPGSPIPPSC